MQAWNNSAAFKMKQNLQLKIGSSRKHMHYQILQLSTLASVVQTQSTHWQTGTQLKYSRKYCVHFHANNAVLFSEGCNVSFFCEEIFVCKPRWDVFSICMYSRSGVCVVGKLYFLCNTEALQLRLLRVCQVLWHKE